MRIIQFAIPLLWLCGGAIAAVVVWLMPHFVRGYREESDRQNL